MKQYRSKPKIVNAEQWYPGREVPGVFPHPNGYFVTTIHNQRVFLTPGDFVVQEPDGEHYYPVKPDIFKASYEPY
jgi:hypothetical protein